MNNKKIIFGILLFCAISFIAYTFANPLENDKEEGKLMPGSSTEVKSPNTNDNEEEDNNEEETQEPDENEDNNQDEVVPPVSQTGTQPSGNTGSNRPNTGGNTNRPTTPTEVPVNGIVIPAPSSTVLVLGSTTNLGATVSPNNATNKNITYTSSNTNVITVDANGNMKAVGVGTATVTVTANNGVTNSFTFTVAGNTSSLVTVSSKVDNLTINTTKNGNTIMLYGTFEKDKNGYYDGVIEVRISVPTAYNQVILPNLRYEVVRNNYGVSSQLHTGLNKIQNLNGISTGNAYISLTSNFTEYTVEDKGKVNINVDWLGIGNPVTYTLDFSNITIKK